MAFHIHARGTVCPLCNQEVKPTGSALINAVQIGGQVLTEEKFEAELAFDPDDDSDAFWNQPDFEEKYLDVLDKNNTMAEHGALPPIELPDENAKKVLVEALTKDK